MLLSRLFQNWRVSSISALEYRGLDSFSVPLIDFIASARSELFDLVAIAFSLDIIPGVNASVPPLFLSCMTKSFS